MEHTENWVWLPKQVYPNDQTTFFSGLQEGVTKRYTVAEFEKKYVFSQKVQRAELRFSGDTAFQLFCNDRIVAAGPACPEGDFIGHDKPDRNFYAFETVVYPD